MGMYMEDRVLVTGMRKGKNLGDATRTGSG